MKKILLVLLLLGMSMTLFAQVGIAGKLSDIILDSGEIIKVLQGARKITRVSGKITEIAIPSTILSNMAKYTPTELFELRRLAKQEGSASFLNQILNDEITLSSKQMKFFEESQEKGWLNRAPLLTIEGKKPINSKFSGTFYSLDEGLLSKYPEGVIFSVRGYPIFSPYSIKTVKIKNLTGNYNIDEIFANKAAELESTPINYVWHHVEDGETLELIPVDLHVAVPHSGGSSLLRYQAGIIDDLAE